MRSKPTLLLLIPALACTPGAFSLQAGEKPAKAIAPTDGPIKLFNGKNFDGLYTWLKDTRYEDPKGVFRVTDGMLHITGDGLGAVITKNAYRDYHQIVEFKWGPRTWGPRKARTKDSGLLIHSLGPDGAYNGIWMTSIEVQIIEGGVGDFILVGRKQPEGKTIPLSLTCETGHDRDGEVVWKKGGKKETFDLDNRRRINWFGRDPDWKDVLGFRGANDVESPDGQWTRLDVICRGGHIQVFVNGTKVNEAFESVPQQGKIQIQAELAEIFIRRWELWPPDKGPKPTKAENQALRRRQVHRQSFNGSEKRPDREDTGGVTILLTPKGSVAALVAADGSL